MNAQEIIAKADRGEGLTEEEIRVYREAVKPVKREPPRIPARHRPSGGRAVRNHVRQAVPRRTV